LAKKPELKKASALRSVKSQLQSAALVAPFVVDFNNDDMADLLVGDQDGAVNLFQALAMRGSKVQYGSAESLDFGRLPGTSLFVVDWNNDNKKDVLVGASDGTVSVYLQNTDSSDLSPEYSYPLFLRDGKGSVINVGSQANPAVVDIDVDGDKDLIVGSGTGKVYLYLNNGSDDVPELAIDPLTLITMTSSSVSPSFVDWDADGDRDLLIASDGDLIRCEPNGDGTYAVAETIVAGFATGIASGARFFVVDADNGQGKDVYIGQADGLVQIMRSSGKEFLPSVSAALIDKLEQISDLAAASGVDVTVAVHAVKTEVEAGDFGAAGRTAKDVVAVSPAGSEMYVAASELIALLNQ
jgi:WD40 repeat protein